MATMAGGQLSLPEAAASGNRPPNGPNLARGLCLGVGVEEAADEAEEGEGEEEGALGCCCWAWELALLLDFFWRRRCFGRLGRLKKSPGFGCNEKVCACELLSCWVGDFSIDVCGVG